MSAAGALCDVDLGLYGKRRVVMDSDGYPVVVDEYGNETPANRLAAYLAHRLAEAADLLARGVDASAFDGLEPLEAEVMVFLGRWREDGEGGYVAVEPRP